MLVPEDRQNNIQLVQNLAQNIFRLWGKLHINFGAPWRGYVPLPWWLSQVFALLWEADSLLSDTDTEYEDARLKTNSAASLCRSQRCHSVDFMLRRAARIKLQGNLTKWVRFHFSNLYDKTDRTYTCSDLDWSLQRHQLGIWQGMVAAMPWFQGKKLKCP